MIRVSQNILLFSSRLGNGWLRSGSTGMPERAKARRSSATVDMATRLPARGAGEFVHNPARCYLAHGVKNGSITVSNSPGRRA